MAQRSSAKGNFARVLLAPVAHRLATHCAALDGTLRLARADGAQGMEEAMGYQQSVLREVQLFKQIAYHLLGAPSDTPWLVVAPVLQELCVQRGIASAAPRALAIQLPREVLFVTVECVVAMLHAVEAQLVTVRARGQQGALQVSIRLQRALPAPRSALVLSRFGEECNAMAALYGAQLSFNAPRMLATLSFPGPVRMCAASGADRRR